MPRPPRRRFGARFERLEDRITPATLLHTLLPDPAPQAGALFGTGAAADATYQVVGAPYADVGGLTDVGQAFVYDAATGALIATLNNPTPSASDLFGFSVGVSGGVVVVGAQWDDTGASNAGSAYVFDAATGNLLRTLNNPTPEAGDEFGVSVGVSGDTVVVGAHYDGTGATWAGSAYVFSAASGALLQTLNNPTPAVGDVFGETVAVSGSTVVVGAFADDTGATDTGSAYIFDAVTGSLLKTLNNPALGTDDHFGSSVAVSGSRVAIGANYDTIGPATKAGTAYVFDAATSGLVSTLNNPTPATDDLFGVFVSVSGDTVVVGAHFDDAAGTDTGSAYLFDAATGSLQKTLTGPAAATGDEFGRFVAISGTSVVVTALRKDAGAPDAGSAYVFDATTGSLTRTLVNSTESIDDEFGFSVAASGGYTVVGAPFTDAGGLADVGRAYVFDAASGDLVVALENPTPAAGDLFGYAVAVSGSTVVVSALWDDTGASNAGSAYVFDAATGALVATLNNPTPADGDELGNSVGVSGNTVVVGSRWDDTGAADAGSAYVFDADTGALRFTLNNPTPVTGDQFGISVKVAGNVAAVGAIDDDTGAVDTGSAYIFDAATGGLVWTLNNPTPGAGDWFGYSVAAAGNTVVVGAIRDDTGASNAGSAYVFNADTGTLRFTLNNPFPVADDQFGYSVAVAGNYLLVGADLDDAGAADSGAAYAFDATTAVRIDTMAGPAPTGGDRFGVSVALSGGFAVAGAMNDDTQNTDQGAAYVFALPTLAPTLTAPGSQGASEGSSATIALGSLADANSSGNYAVTVNWGDGTTDTVFNQPAAGSLGTRAHTYAQDGKYTVTVSAADVDGTSKAMTFPVTVANVPPAVAAAPGQSAVMTVAQSFALGSFADPGADNPWAVIVDWGDGSPATVFGLAAAGAIPAKSHTYASAGLFTVTVTVADDDSAAAKSFAATVSGTPPVLTPPADQVASEGTAAVIALGSLADANASGSYTVTVNWGDGTPNTVFGQASVGSLGTQTHTFAQDGQYTVTLTAADSDGASVPTAFTVTIANALPTVTAAPDQTATMTVNQPFALGNFADPGADSPWTVTVDWGDASTDSVFILSAAGTIPALTHTFAASGVFNVTVSVADDNGSGSASFDVNVAGTPPTLIPPGPQSAPEGPAAFALGTLVDANASGNYAVTVNWGDGTAPTKFTQPAPGSLGTRPHSYVQDGKYTVSVTAADIDGNSAPITFLLTITNATPVVTAAANQTAVAAAAQAFHLGGFSDPGADAPWTVTVNWGDGSTPASFSVTAAGPLADRAHTFAAAGKYTVTVTVADDDGSGSATYLVAVAGAPPVVTPPNGQAAAEGTASTFDLGSVTDPDDTGPYAVKVSWGDGTPDTAFARPSTGTLGTVAHTFARDGTFTVSVMVTDASGLSAAGAFAVAVSNVAPSVTAAPDQAATTGTAAALALGSFADPGADASWSVTVDWGDGTAPTGFGAVAPGALPTTSHTYASAGTYTVVVTVSDGTTAGAGSYRVTVADRPRPPAARQFAVGADAGGSGVRLFDPDRSERFSVTPFPGFTGGVRTAAADFTGDGIADLVVGTGPGGPTHVRVLDGVTQAELFALDPFEATFTGGVFVAAGDVTGDGLADLVVTPDEGGGPRARVFSGAGFGQLADFFGIEDTAFRGGARPAVGDLDGDGFADLVVAAGFGGGPRVAAFSGKSLPSGPVKLFGDFLAFEPALRNGTFVAAGDIDGDGKAELIAGGGPGGGPRVTVFDGADLLANVQTRSADFFAGDTANRGGVRLTAKDLDGDSRADLVTGAGAGAGSRVTAYSGRDLTGGGPPELFALDAFPGFSGGVFVG